MVIYLFLRLAQTEHLCSLVLSESLHFKSKVTWKGLCGPQNWEPFKYVLETYCISIILTISNMGWGPPTALSAWGPESAGDQTGASSMQGKSLIPCTSFQALRHCKGYLEVLRTTLITFFCVIISGQVFRTKLGTEGDTWPYLVGWSWEMWCWGHQTQGFTHARQLLYHVGPIPRWHKYCLWHSASLWSKSHHYQESRGERKPSKSLCRENGVEANWTRAVPV